MRRRRRRAHGRPALPVALAVLTACRNTAGAHSPPQPALPAGAAFAILSPRAGDTLIEGRSYIIRWSAPADSRISLGAAMGGKDKGMLLTDAPARPDTLVWTIPVGFVTGFGPSSSDRIRLRLEYADSAGVFTETGPFTIRGTPALPARSTPPNDSIPAHDTFTVASRALGESRPVNVHTPSGYRASSTGRLPVLYMPDGGLDEDFPHVVHTVDSLVALGAIRPVIVVGIPNTERRRDLTGPTHVGSDSAIAPRVGGSAAFRRFLSDEVIPAVETRYRTTRERAIVGESLAGLFVVETFLTEPELFDHYVALDPSLWWNDGVLIDSASARLAALDAAPRTLYLASSNVSEIASGTAHLATLLRAASRPGLTWVYVPRPDLTHATIFRGAGPAALKRALR